MTSEEREVREKHKSFDGKYIYFDQYSSNGICLGMKPTDESGFIYKFLEYSYPINTVKKLHTHRYDKELIPSLVDEMLSRIVGYSQ